MHRTEADNKIEVGGKNLYTDGPPGTTIEADDRNTIQEELAYLIETAGLTLKTAATETDQQVYDAVIALIAANSPNSPKVDFESKNLIINVQTTETVDADAKRLSLLNTSNVPAYIDNLNTTFNIATDLMAGTTEKASTWYQLWIDSGGTRLMVPDLESTTDGTTASKLVDSGADFVTDKVQVGDEVYNQTDKTKTTVTAVDDLNTLSLAADIFVSGEDYKIRALSPVGLGTAFKANIGAAYNNAAENFDDSTYTQIQEEKFYSEAAGDFAVTHASNWTTIQAKSTIKQLNDWTGKGVWSAEVAAVGDTTIGSVGAYQLAISGIVFENLTNWEQPGFVSELAGHGFDNIVSSFAVEGTGNFLIDMPTTTLTGRIGFSISALLNKKPSFHK